MSRWLKPSRISWSLVLILTTAALSSCAGEANDPTSPTISTVTVNAKGGAKGGGGGGGGGTAPGVTGANPSSLPKGIVNVDLEITGSGFTSSSEVGFELDGVETEGIVTNAVSFVDETRLVANVDVSEEALETLYDIAVRNGPKKKGVGIDLLKVVAPVTYPQVQGQELFGGLTGRVYVYETGGGLLTGVGDLETTGEECGFVYDLSTGQLDCLDIEIDGTSYIGVHPTSVNASGRVVGSGCSAPAECALGFVMDYPSPPERLTVPEPWEVYFIRSVNDDGQVLGQIARPDPDPHPSDWNARLSALALWTQGTDGTWSVSISASAKYMHAEGLSNGPSPVALGQSSSLGGSIWWDGTPGAVPTLLDEGGFKSASAMDITADGMVFGHELRGTTYETLVWDEVFSSPYVLTELSIKNPFHDRDGHLVGDGAEGTFCIDPASPSQGITELVPAGGMAMARAWTGADGKIYGYSSDDSFSGERIVTVWDLSGETDGCRSP